MRSLSEKISVERLTLEVLFYVLIGCHDAMIFHFRLILWRFLNAFDIILLYFNSLRSFDLSAHFCRLIFTLYLFCFRGSSLSVSSLLSFIQCIFVSLIY